MILLFLLIHQQKVRTHPLERLHHISLKFVWLDVRVCWAFFKQVIFNFKPDQLKEMKVIDNFDNETIIQFFKIIQNQDINEGKFLFNYPDNIDVIKN